MIPVSASAIERLWANIAVVGDCWVWQGATMRGYGAIQLSSPKRVLVRTHRLAWELTHGEIPEGYFVCHNCPGGDNRACINPDHLFLGTHDDNMRDMREKGRAASGERSGRATKPHRTARGSRVGGAKLTEEQAAEIRATYVPRVVSRPLLAKRFGVDRTTIDRVLSGRSW